MNAPSTGPAPTRKRWRKLKRFGAALVVLALLLVVGGFWISYWNANRLQTAIDETEREDSRWRMADLLAGGEPVLDHENAALTIREVLGSLPGSGWLGDSAGDGSTAPQRLSAIFGQSNSLAPNILLDDERARRARDDLTALESALTQARALAEQSRGHLDLTPADILGDGYLDLFQDNRNVARLLQVDAALRAHQGELNRALDDVRGILNTGRAIGDVPGLNPSMVRIAIENISVATLQRVLAQGEASDAALAKVEALLADESATPLLAHALRGERAYSYEAMMDLHSGMTGSGPFSWLLGIPSGAMLGYNEAIILRWFGETIAIAKRPLPEQPGLWDAWETTVRTAPKSALRTQFGMLADLMQPALKSSANASWRAHALLNVGRLMIALERYRIAEGHWPESAAELVPTYLPALPADPFSKEPVRFGWAPGGLAVYSVGPDGTDDGGHLGRRNIPAPGIDWGFRLFDLDQRRQPAPELPDDVFQEQPR